MSQFSKEFSISKLITSGIVSQFLGNIVTFDSMNDNWVFKGLTKFLEYQIGIKGSTSLSDEMFVSEVLHPTLQLKSFSSELPFSADEALSDEVARKGEKLQLKSEKFQCHPTLFSLIFLSCLHFPNDLSRNRERSFCTNIASFDRREV